MGELAQQGRARRGHTGRRGERSRNIDELADGMPHARTNSWTTDINSNVQRRTVCRILQYQGDMEGAEKNGDGETVGPGYVTRRVRLPDRLPTACLVVDRNPHTEGDEDRQCFAAPAGPNRPNRTCSG